MPAVIGEAASVENKFQASYSVLNAWASGNWERAIKMYFKLDSFTTEAMADGSYYHDKWCEEVKKTGRLPDEFGGGPLKNPVCETRLFATISDWLELAGTPDVVDSPIIYDYKTGKGMSELYARSKQLPVYGVLCTLNNIYVEKGVILHYDQYTGKLENSYVWLTDKALQDAMNWVETYASEMHSYFLEQHLYEKFANHQKTM